MKTVYSFNLGDPQLGTIGTLHRSDISGALTFYWDGTISRNHEICLLHASEPAVRDSDGHVYSGDEFWDRAGDWDWQRSGEASR